MSENSAHGYGLATLTEDGDVLDVWFPEPRLGVPAHDPEPEELTALTGDDPVRQVRKAVVHVVVDDLAAAPADTYDVWLRLHLLSHRLVKPHGLNLDGQFGLLSNVVWTNFGPCAVEGFEQVRSRLRIRGVVTVFSVDKFPRMVDYVVPSGVRIGDADRVRLGAHLASGTTVMHEGFVNFNAMGTLSGGGTQVISIGSGSLLGANSGIGISLGDDCVVAAGCYVTAGTKVRTPDGTVVKAAELSGQDNLLFLTNSETGQVEARPRGERRGIELNSDLHAN